MNNAELCDRIRNVAMSETKNFSDTFTSSVIERIVAHFDLEAPRILGEQHVDRNKSLQDIKIYLDTQATELDKYWILNHLSLTPFSDAITQLSPNFVATFREAEIAYANGLCLICGNGFRKAAEHLIYDYAVNKTQDENAVKYTVDKHGKQKEKTFCDRITEYLSDAPDVQDLANAARKLGNNFTHIIDDGDENYSLENLKAFVTLLASDISEIISPDEDVDYNTRMLAKKILNKN